MKSSLKESGPGIESIKRMLDKFKNDEVLVGIPESRSDRKEGKITNAALLAINEYGSPANNIPPRPVMGRGIRNAQDQIAEEYKKAIVAALSKGSAAIETYYQRAGIIASNSIKKVINDQEGIDPPSPATLRARESQGFKGTKALIRTGQMRNSITYVLRKG